MTTTSALISSAVCGYLCGSLPFGYWAGKLRGIDIRQYGSGNIGATNVIRVMGKGIGIPVFLLDMIKGWLPVILARSWMLKCVYVSKQMPWMHSIMPGGCVVTGSPEEDAMNVMLISLAAVVAGFSAVLGHMFPFWLQFKGGKGIATTAGVLLGISTAGFIGGWIAWLIVFFSTRYVSLASIAAAVAVPSSMAIMMAREGSWDWVLLSFGLLVMILAIYKHSANIKRLLAGTESKMGVKKT